MIDPVHGPDGAPLSAGELCVREGCWHRWFDHDHIGPPVGASGFGWCAVVGAEGRCSCVGFVAATDSPTVGPSPFAMPFPGPPGAGP